VFLYHSAVRRSVCFCNIVGRYAGMAGKGERGQLVLVLVKVGWVGGRVVSCACVPVCVRVCVCACVFAWVRRTCVCVWCFAFDPHTSIQARADVNKQAETSGCTAAMYAPARIGPISHPLYTSHTRYTRHTPVIHVTPATMYAATHNDTSALRALVHSSADLAIVSAADHWTPARTALAWARAAAGGGDAVRYLESVGAP